MKKYIQKRRQDWIDSQGGHCVKCGSTDELEVDHIYQEEKSREVSSLWVLKESTRMDELKKCQVLCHDCHLEKTVAEKDPMRHGTWYSAYFKKCKCEDCLAYVEAYNVQRREKRSKTHYSKHTSMAKQANAASLKGAS